MTFKDIVVFADLSRAGVARLRLAAKLALRHAAHLACVYVVPEHLGELRHDAFVRGDKAIGGMLDRRCRAEEWAILRMGQQFAKTVTCDLGQAEFHVVRYRVSDRNVILNTRYADLVVIGQQSTGLPQYWLPEHLLLANGVPTIVMPDGWTSGLIGERVVLAGNASKEVRRAADDAMPFMADARCVTVIVVDAGKDPDRYGEVPGANIALHLARHGVRVEIERITSDGQSVSASLLAAADRLGADLIVMGANGHSHPRHLLFGSTTSDVRKDARLPVLTSG